MHTWEGFWRHTTAKGPRVNLFHFGLLDQFDRAVVFWSLLRLPFSLPVILIVTAGLVWLARRVPKPAILIYLFLLTHLLFTLNTVQDVMAYLLLPFAALSIAAGAGALALTELGARLTRHSRLSIVHYSLFMSLRSTTALPGEARARCCSPTGNTALPSGSTSTLGESH
jgi:hypothetical protein